MKDNIENSDHAVNTSQKNVLEEYSLKNQVFSSNGVSVKEYKDSGIDIEKGVVSCSSSQSTENIMINPKNSRFPYCIVWTPIPLITYLFPSIGHTGIGNSEGIIHDFAGSFFVSIDDFAFGKPTKYLKLDLNERERYEFDRGVEKADNKFNMEEHNLFTNNCHSHVAYVLNQIRYKGKTNYNMVDIWWMLILKGKYISICSFIKTYLGFFILAFIIWFLTRKK